MKKMQDTFREFLKNEVAPKLREHGLQGSGQNYSIKSDTHWALIGFQKSSYSDASDLKFTINLYVVAKAEWDETRQKRSYFPEKPSANVHWPIGWVKRIGFLLPNAQDYWWSLDSSSDLNQLSFELIESICDKAIPAMMLQIERTR